MRYIKIDDYDIYNGPGARVTLWVSGCPHKCKGCHNPHTWNEYQGIEEDINITIEKLLTSLDLYYPLELSILGGEPLAPYNIEGITEICKRIKEQRPNTNIWIWTGYTYEDIKDKEIFSYIDTIVDGKYIESLHVKEKYYGSSNQRVIHIEK